MYDYNSSNNTGVQQYYQNPQQFDPMTGMPINNGPTGSTQSYSAPVENVRETSAPKKQNTFGRIMMTICMGLLFGLFAGVGFFTVNLLTADHIKPEPSPAPVLEGTTSSQPNVLQGTTLSIDPSIPTEVRVLTTEETDITEVVADVMPSMVSITEYYTVSTTYWG